MDAFFKMLHKANISCMALVGREGEGCISVIGSGAEIRAALKNCFDQVKAGCANEGQQAVYDAIMDVLALNFSIGELRQILPKRVDNLLKK